jgi:predicted alpha-1,6-mannanase (GH76 family)
LGTPADWFVGLRAVKKPKEQAGVDGLLSQQFHLLQSELEQKLTAEERAKRDALERTVLQFREKKSQMPEEEYYRQLEKLLLELARASVTNSSKL